ncbi:MAG: 4Fe-4S binding protein [Candidatus Brocadiia bacterium]
MKRKVIRIDEDKCNGCGLCIPNCREGALAIVDGKARLVSDVYCDGLGACLGHCPQDAISIEEREAAEFDELAVKQHLQEKTVSGAQVPIACGCPGSAVRQIAQTVEASIADEGVVMQSELRTWPVQLRLVPPSAPYLNGASVTICADCVPFAYASFHQRFVRGRVVLCVCPKLDDPEVNLEKLIAIFESNDIKSIEIPHMEVPCCTGLVALVKLALIRAGKLFPTTATKVSVSGDILERRTLEL